MILPPLHPSAVSFSELLQDPHGSHARDLARANAARARVRSTLKQVRRRGITSPDADWTQAIRALEEYLPFLAAIIACVEADDLLLRAEPEFVWQAALSTHSLKKGSPRIRLRSLHYELIAVHTAYGISLMNQGSLLVSALGKYETDASVSIDGIRSRDETINTAADILCRASGVFEYLSTSLIPSWEAIVGLENIAGRPLEITSDVTSALAKIAHADANLLAIRKLMSKALSVAHTTIAPGPPLDKAHPSPSLLAKLHIQVFTLYDEARTLCKGASSTSSSSTGEIDPALRRYLSDGRLLGQALAYKWLGIDAGENGGPNKIGDALGWLELSKAALREIEGRRSGLNKLKFRSKAGAKSRKDKITAEQESVSAFIAAYKTVNDKVHFQPVPTAATLQTMMPSGRAALAPKRFAPSSPAFSPTSSLRFSGGASQSPANDVKELDMSTLTFDDNDDSDDEAEGQVVGADIETTGYW